MENIQKFLDDPAIEKSKKDAVFADLKSGKPSGAIDQYIKDKYYYKMDMSPKKGIMDSNIQLAGNIAKGVGNIGIGAFNTVMHPIDTLTAGIEGAVDTGKNVVKGAENVITSGMNITNKAVYPALNTLFGTDTKRTDVGGIFTEGAPANQSVGADLTQGASGLLNASQGLFPVASTLFNAGANTEVGKQVLAPVNIATKSAVDLAKQSPEVSNFYNSLSPDRRGDFDNVLNNVIQLGATKGISNIKSVQNIPKIPGKIIGVMNEGMNKVNIPNPLPKVKNAIDDIYSNISTGMKKSEIEGIKNNPYSAEDITNLDSAIKQGKVDDIKNYVNDVHEQNANTVMSTIDAMKDGKGEFGKIYQEIDNTNATVPINTVLQNLQESLKSQIDFVDGVAIRRPGSKSKTINDSDIAKINGVIEDMRADAMRNNGVLSPEQIRTVRSTMSKYSKYDKNDKESLTYDGTQLMKDMRESIDNTAKDHIPGLREADAIYHDKIQAIEDALKDLVYKGGDTKGDYRSNIVSIISNLDKKNRSVLANRLEEVMPGIIKKVESINNLPTVYTAVTKMPKQAGFVGGATAGATMASPLGIPGLLVGGAIGSIVGVLAENAITAGKMSKIIKEVSKDTSIKQAEILRTAEKIKNNEALDAKANEVLEAIRKKIIETEGARIVEVKKGPLQLKPPTEGTPYIRSQEVGKTGPSVVDILQKKQTPTESSLIEQKGSRPGGKQKTATVKDILKQNRITPEKIEKSKREGLVIKKSKKSRNK